MTGRPPSPRSWSSYPASRMLLLGTGTHQTGSELADVPAVADTLLDLEHALVSRAGVNAGNVRVVLDPESPTELGDAIADEVERAEGLLAVFYIGHGLISERGELHLATKRTKVSATRLGNTAFRYLTLREQLRVFETGGPDRSLVVVLDCCFAGRAHDWLGGSDTTTGLTDIRGVYVLTSAGRDELALAPPGERHTAFTGGLIRLLTKGDPDGPAAFTLHNAFEHLARTLPQAGSPRPRSSSTDLAGDLILAPNPAYRPRRTVPDPVPGSPAPGLAGVCPYKGLASFQASDEQLFFGRERLTATLMQRLAQAHGDGRPLFVIGASGSGKSSVLQAGLLPALGRGELGIAGSAGWRTVSLRPTADPVDTLARTMAGHNPPLALIVDQFEELFTECRDESVRRAFVDAVCATARGGAGRPAAAVVIGVRADFYGYCAAYPALVPALEDHAVVVAAMSTDELRTAIEKPATLTGIALEPGLTELVLTDLGVRRTTADAAPEAPVGAGRRPEETDGPPAPQAYDAGKLPLLAHVLEATWQRRDGRIMRAAAYTAAGGIQGALAATGERALARIAPEHRDTAKSLLLRLVHVGEGTEDLRRRVSRTDLLAELADFPDAAAVLHVFISEEIRLVTADRGSVELTHEALLHAWPTLRDWIDEDRADLLIAQQLNEAARQWEYTGRDRSTLYGGSRLTFATEWAGPTRNRRRLTPAAHRFLTASERAQRRGKRRRAGAYISLVGALVVTLVVVTGDAVRQRRAAEQERRVAAGQRLVAQAAELRASRPQQSMLLAALAARLAPGAETRADLVDALAGNRYTGSTADQRPLRAVAFASEHVLVTGGDSGAGDVWDVADPVHPRRLGSFGDGRAPIRSLAVSRDGRIIATGDAAGRTSLWALPRPGGPIGGRPTATAGFPIQRLSVTGLHSRPVLAVAFSRDAALLATGGQDGRWTLSDISAPTRPRLITGPRPGQGAGVQSVAFDRRDAMLALGADDGTATLWDTRDPAHPRLRSRLAQGPGPVYAVAFHPTRAVLALARWDGLLVFWDVDTPAQPVRLATVDERAPIRTLAFDDSGATLATGGDDSTVRLWNIANPTRPVRLADLRWHTNTVLAARFSPSGRTLATAGNDRSAILWRVTDPAHPVRLDPPPLRIVVPPAALASRPAAVGGYRPVAVAWAGTDRPGALVGVNPTVKYELDPGGHLLATQDGDVAALWDLRGPQPPRRLPATPLTGLLGSMTLSPDGATLAVSEGGTTTLWDFTDPARPRWVSTLPGDRLGSALRFTPDHRTLATGHEEPGGGEVVLWDVGDHGDPRRLAALVGQRGSGALVEFSPDGRTLATIDAKDRVVVLWDITDRAAPSRLAVMRDPNGEPSSVRFGPDGRMLASAVGGAVTLWDITVLSRPSLLTALPPVQSERVAPIIAFSASSKTLVVAGRRGVSQATDRSVVAWDIGPLHDVVADPLTVACRLLREGPDRSEWSSYAPGVPYVSLCVR